MFVGHCSAFPSAEPVRYNVALARLVLCVCHDDNAVKRRDTHKAGMEKKKSTFYFF